MLVFLFKVEEIKFREEFIFSYIVGEVVVKYELYSLCF